MEHCKRWRFFRSCFIFHFVWVQPNWKAPWKIWRLQLPIFIRAGKPLSSLVEEIFSYSDQFTCGPSMENWIILLWSNSLIASFKHKFKSSAEQYFRNLEVKYWTQDLCLEQSQYDTTKSVNCFLRTSLRLSSKDIEKKAIFLQALLVSSGKMDQVQN